VIEYQVVSVSTVGVRSGAKKAQLFVRNARTKVCPPMSKPLWMVAMLHTHNLGLSYHMTGAVIRLGRLGKQFILDRLP